MPVTPLRDADPVQVGPHRLLGRIGQGGMGTVFLAVTPDDRAVAVKVLRDGLADPDARQRFRHELEALRRVKGPHLVEVLDADVDAETPYLVTRFVPGTRLDDLVNRSGPLACDDLLKAARGLADALTTLHAAGVVHRDLTPGNVLMLDGQPHVIDLGLAIAADVTALTRSGLVIGTPGYLAPEQVIGSAVTTAVDVHAWGATIAFAATGRAPYGTGRPEAVLYRIVHDQPDLDGLPVELADLVTAAMGADPQGRPTADEVLAELGGACQLEPVTVHLPRGVDATTLLPPGLWEADQGIPRTALVTGSTRELVAAAVGPPSRFLPSTPDQAIAPDLEQALPSDGSWDFEPDLLPFQQDILERLPARTHPVRALQVGVTGAAVLAVLTAGTLVAPVVGTAIALLLVLGLRTLGRSSERLRDRRDRRGDRRRDPVVATIGAPWHLLLALADTLVAVPLLVLVAGPPAVAVWLIDPVVNGLERPELTIATATVVSTVALLARRAHAGSRVLLRRTLLTMTPGVSSGIAVLFVLIAVAALLLATAEGRAAVFWPLVGVAALN